MPTQPLRRCSFPNCRNRVKFGRCEEHQQKKVDDRLPSSQRGYDHRWRKYRAEYLKHNPIDHIKPVENGQADPLFWRVDNHQALCRDCHSYKTRVIDKRGFGAKK